MAERKRVKVIKNGSVKHIYENELPTYIAMGWTELKEYNFKTNTFNKVK